MHFFFYSCSKVKRKKQAAPEKPVKKQKTGESSKGAASKQSSNRDENMFQCFSQSHTCSPPATNSLQCKPNT
uniref:Uncharacterized protein n=1 Tax=Accipiter nisus TaxID=211598 RepID=A0A8B9S1M6_9AVES